MLQVATHEASAPTATAFVAVVPESSPTTRSIYVPARSAPEQSSIWSRKVSTDSTPNSRIDQISTRAGRPRTRIGSGRIFRLIRISRPEYMNIMKPPTTAEMTSSTIGWPKPASSTTMPISDQAPDQPGVDLALVGVARVRGLDHVRGQPAGVVDDAQRRGEQRERADRPEQVLEPRADPLAQHLALGLQEADAVLQAFAAEDRGVRQQRGEQDRQEGDQDERGQLLDVGEPPPAAPALQVLRGRLEDVAGARRRLRLAGDRADQPGHVAAHAEALVPDPVRLHQVLPAAGAGEGQRAEQQGEAQLASGSAGWVTICGGSAQAAAPIAKIAATTNRVSTAATLSIWARSRATYTTGARVRINPTATSMPIAIQRRLAAEEVGGQGRRAGRPAGPQVGEVGEDREDQAPVPPVPAESGQRGLAGGQRVPLDLHVEEVLGGQADQRRPDEDQADLGGDVGEEDELTGGQADAGGDDARADQPPVLLGSSGMSRTSGLPTLRVGKASATAVPSRRASLRSLSAPCLLLVEVLLGSIKLHNR